jgi:hypothetical protein
MYKYGASVGSSVNDFEFSSGDVPQPFLQYIAIENKF